MKLSSLLHNTKVKIFVVQKHDAQDSDQRLSVSILRHSANVVQTKVREPTKMTF
jgi:hypothetical protein